MSHEREKGKKRLKRAKVSVLKESERSSSWLTNTGVCGCVNVSIRRR